MNAATMLTLPWCSTCMYVCHEMHLSGILAPSPLFQEEERRKRTDSMGSDGRATPTNPSTPRETRKGLFALFSKVRLSPLFLGSLSHILCEPVFHIAFFPDPLFCFLTIFFGCVTALYF